MKDWQITAFSAKSASSDLFVSQLSKFLNYNPGEGVPTLVYGSNALFLTNNKIQIAITLYGLLEAEKLCFSNSNCNCGQFLNTCQCPFPSDVYNLNLDSTISEGIPRIQPTINWRRIPIWNPLTMKGLRILQNLNTEQDLNEVEKFCVSKMLKQFLKDDHAQFCESNKSLPFKLLADQSHHIRFATNGVLAYDDLADLGEATWQYKFRANDIYWYLLVSVESRLDRKQLCEIQHRFYHEFDSSEILLQFSIQISTHEIKAPPDHRTILFKFEKVYAIKLLGNNTMDSENKIV